MSAKSITSQIGTSWANLLQDIGYIYNIPVIDYETVEEMLKDETVRAALQFQVLNIVNMMGDYTHEDKEVQDFVFANFENLETTLETTLEEMVFTKKAYGFSAAELVWEEKDGRYFLRKLVILPPSTLRFRINNGGITSAEQLVVGKGTVEIPREKLFILREGRNVYGQSALQHVYRAWKFKSVLFKFWAMAMERYAVPVLVGKTADPGSVGDLLDALKDLWSNGVVAVSGDVEVNTLEAKNSIAETFESAIEYANMLIYRGFLLPQLLASTREVGSKALGEVHLKLFTTSLRREARRLADEVIDQIVARIIAYNFENVENYGDFIAHEEPNSEERVRLAQMTQMLVQAGIIDPVDDAEWIRALLGLPAPSGNEELSEGDEGAWALYGLSHKHISEQKTE